MADKDKEEDKYKHVKAAIAKYEANEVFLDTLKHHHSKAYMKGAEEHLMNKKGEIELKRLKSRDVQDALANSMADFYLKQAKEVYNANPDSDMKAEHLMQMYSGITRTELRKIIHSRKENFDHDFFLGRLAGNLVNRVRERISDIPYLGLKEEHKDDIIKHIAKESGKEVNEWVDTSKMSLEDATRLLEAYVTQGGLLEKQIEGETFHKKKEKKKAA